MLNHRSVTVGIALFAPALSEAATAQSFREQVLLSDFTTGSEHYALMDVDGDGTAELVVAPFAESGVKVYKAGASGLFEFISHYGVTGSDSARVMPMDLDGDGDQDLVFGARWDAFAIENVDGQLSSEPPIQIVDIQGFYRGVATGDVNGDGRDDLLTAVGGVISMWASHGFAMADPAVTFPGGGENVLIVKDIDGDGLMDVVYDEGPSGLMVRPGEASLPIGMPRSTSLSNPGPGGIDFADVDGDGDLDALVAEGSFARVYEQTSPFTFVQIDEVGSLGGGPVSGASFQDVDGDAVLDLTFASTTAGNDYTFEVAVGDGSGDWSRRLVHPTGVIAGASSRYRPSFTDLNRDGKPDLILASGSSSTLNARFRVSFNLTQVVGAPFFAPPQLHSNLPRTVFEFAVSDFDEDGDPDIVAAVGVQDITASTQQVVLLENDRGLSFRPATLLWEVPDLPGSAGFFPSIETGDFDGDGRSDVLIARFLGAAVDCLLMSGDGEGNFSPPERVLSLPPPAGPVISASILGSAAKDLIVRRPLASSTEFQVFENRLDVGGGFRLAATFSSTEATALARAEDVNGDGRSDIVIWTGLGAGYYPQLADGSFSARVSIVDLQGTNPAGTTGLGLGDINGDGLKDAVWVKQGLPRVMLGSGSGSFSPPVEGMPGMSSRQTHLADMDLDGALDLVGMQMGGSNSNIRYGNGTGGFDSGISFDRDSDQMSAYAELHDMDLDGDLDIVRLGSLLTVLEVMVNTTRPWAGEGVCGPAVPNSIGLPAVMSASGSPSAASSDLRLRATQLPPGRTVMFFGGTTQMAPMGTLNSVGRFCISDPIGRYNRPGQIRTSSAAGAAELLVDPTQLIVGGGTLGVMPGESHTFQAWYRDADGAGSVTTNFTDAVVIQFE